MFNFLKVTLALAVMALIGLIAGLAFVGLIPFVLSAISAYGVTRTLSECGWAYTILFIGLSLANITGELVKVKQEQGKH